MNTKPVVLCFAAMALLCVAAPLAAPAQAPAPAGFIISMKNGSTIRGRTLSRDAASGTLRLAMTETADGSPKSYAVISMDDAEAIRAATSETDSILIALRGGSELRCREFTMDGETITVKLGSATRIEVPWGEVESISFR